MCYVYFRMWLSFLLRDSAPAPRFPSVPTLFMFGTKKRIMFHDQRCNLSYAYSSLVPLMPDLRFIEKLRDTPGCSSKAFDQGKPCDL